MRKLIVTEFVSLDGVMEAPGGEPGHPHSGWVFDFMSDEQQEWKLKETMEADALLLGRKTYEGFAAAWPEREGDFADKMNSMPKHVVSGSLSELDWQNSEVLAGDPAESVPRLKETEGGPILVAGSGTLVHALIEAGLVDELRLMVFPVALGSGLRVFPESSSKNTFRLAATESFPTGVQANTYEPA
jgi:dihydrofolate reductase